MKSTPQPSMKLTQSRPARSSRSIPGSCAGVPSNGSNVFSRCAIGFAITVFVFASAARSHFVPSAAHEDDEPVHSLASKPSSDVDPRRFVLNALVAAALDPDIDPPRWIAPLAAMSCHGASGIRVDGSPLIPGTTVPPRPFALEWFADDCRPFGLQGPRFDGAVGLFVEREGELWRAAVFPRGMTVTTSDGQVRRLEAGPARMPLATTPTPATAPSHAAAPLIAGVPETLP